jgi:D-sedoheptulose 7-phosphate isomerase
MFAKSFLDQSVEILRQISVDEIDGVVALLARTREQGGRLFFCGSGGGAGHASHATCDFRKLGGFEAYCVSDNVSELTARINDDSWDTAYSNWLRASRFRAGDCLFVFSVGGGSVEPPVSTNLVSCMELAKEVGASIVGVAGRDGGALRQLADACVVIPTADPALVTPHTEGFQALMWHLIVSHPMLAQSIAKWEGIEATATAVR